MSARSYGGQRGFSHALWPSETAEVVLVLAILGRRLVRDPAVAHELSQAGVHGLHTLLRSGLHGRGDLVALAVANQGPDGVRRDQDLRGDGAAATGPRHQLLGHDSA